MRTTTQNSPFEKLLPLFNAMKKPPETADAECLLKASELKAALGMSRAKVYRMMQDGTLPTVRIGGSDHVPLRALGAWIEQYTRPGKAEPKTGTEGGSAV